MRGCAAQGLCKACTQAGWDVPALSTKGLFSPASCSHGKQGMERHSQKSQLSSIPARMVQQLPVLQPSPELCLWYGLCQALLASCRAGQATPLCKFGILAPGLGKPAPMSQGQPTPCAGVSSQPCQAEGEEEER